MEAPRVHDASSTANLYDLLMIYLLQFAIIFPIGVPLQIDDSFLWPSDPVTPSNPSSDHVIPPRPYEIGTNRSPIVQVLTLLFLY
jgi:hypothetical protein